MCAGDAAPADPPKHSNEEVRRRFSIFYGTAGLLHAVVFAFSLIREFILLDIEDNQFATCVRNDSSFGEIYAAVTPHTGSLTMPPVSGDENATAYTCVIDVHDQGLYIFCLSLSGLLMLAAFLVHRCRASSEAAVLVVDVVILTVVYVADLVGWFFSTNDFLGHWFQIPTLSGARGLLAVATFMCLWKCVVNALPFSHLWYFVGPQVVFFVFDVGIMIPATILFPNSDVFWFLLLDCATFGQLVFSSVRRTRDLGLGREHRDKKKSMVELEMRDLTNDVLHSSPPHGGTPPKVSKYPWRLPNAPLRLGRFIGRGLNVEVYAATYQGAPVAVKVISHDPSKGKDGLLNIAKEATMLWRLQKHPFLLPFYGVARVNTGGIEGQRAAMVFEFCPTTLDVALESTEKPWMVRAGQVYPRQAQVLRQIASAMACLHSADVQHCDLKPANIFFGRYGDVKVADFGLSNKRTSLITRGRIDSIHEKHRHVRLLGSPGYITPVLLRLYAGRDMDHKLQSNGRAPTFDYRRHDAFAFVVTGIQILTGDLPYDAHADYKQLTDPEYVANFVEESLASDGIERGFRDCLFDLYMASNSGNEVIDFEAVRLRLDKLPPREPTNSSAKYRTGHAEHKHNP